MHTETTSAGASSQQQQQRPQQFSLAQLLAIVFACGVSLAVVRLFTLLPEARPWDWIVVVLAGVAAVVLFAAVRMNFAAQMAVVVTVFVFLVGIVAQGIPHAQRAARRLACQGHLKQIVVALHSYHDEHRCFPPAVVRDENGRPMHSWRVLLLPYLEQQALYARCRFDEPWDGPNNKKLHGTEMELYACPEQPRRKAPSTDTHYVVIVGPRTAFPEDRCVALSDITDDQGNTLLVVEVANSGIHWMEPRDLHVTQMARQINPPRGQGISSLHPSGGANVVMADGTVKFLDAKLLTADQIEGLVTIAGGEQVQAP